ncbi:MAG: BamA/TamA family outer membrane protein [Deinococcales bacterium]|nr:BamA/TamA family outer membrane protein [Chitinophagaceae bacterium]
MILVSNVTPLQKISSLFCVVCLLAACSSVKDFQLNKPFVFANKVTIKGNISKDEKNRLTNELDNYWDDSLRARKVQQFGFIYKLKNPPVFDSANISRSIAFMNAYLNSQGYYYATFKDSVRLDSVNTKFKIPNKNKSVFNVFNLFPKKEPVVQIRTNVELAIEIGKRITIDSIGFYMFDTLRKPIDSTLQKITLAEANKSLVKKGKPYSKQLISDELDRLVTIYRKNGYYKFTREDIYALADTLNPDLLKLSIDPIEQAKLIVDAAKERNADPTWGFTIMQKRVTDTNKVKQYFVGNLYYYPDVKNIYYNADSLIAKKYIKELVYKSGTMRYDEYKFKFRPLRDHSFLERGSLYNETAYYKTINTLNQIGAWKQVDARPIIREKSDSIDFHFFLLPAAKQSYGIDVEGSRNTGDIGSGNLLGLATNLTYRNRNIWKQAIQSVTQFRLGFEFNIDKSLPNGVEKPFVQTQQLSLSHSYNFPRIIQPFNKWTWLTKNIAKLDNGRTVLSTAGNYTNRIDFYQLRSLNVNFGYDFFKGKTSFQLRIPNIELYKVDTLQGLIQLFKDNPFLRNSFRNGNVLGLSVGSNTLFNGADVSKTHNIRFNVEESGTITNLVTKLGEQVFAYLKLEGEYRYLKKYTKNEFAMRFFIGAALPKSGQTIPVFKQYFVGGPNSMRAWGLRQLGLGSSLASDTTTSGYSDRFGDFNIEYNTEYRFLLTTFAGIKVASALYADIGNIWNIRKVANDADAAFSLKNLGKDVAIGVGTGIRLDFSFFLLRVDFAYKLKDPARLQNGGWANFKNFEWTDTRANGIKIKNYAFQLGIGLPF